MKRRHARVGKTGKCEVYYSDEVSEVETDLLSCEKEQEDKINWCGKKNYGFFFCFIPLIKIKINNI